MLMRAEIEIKNSTSRFFFLFVRCGSQTNVHVMNTITSYFQHLLLWYIYISLLLPILLRLLLLKRRALTTFHVPKSTVPVSEISQSLTSQSCWCQGEVVHQQGLRRPCIITEPHLHTASRGLAVGVFESLHWTLACELFAERHQQCVAQVRQSWRVTCDRPTGPGR